MRPRRVGPGHVRRVEVAGLRPRRVLWMRDAVLAQTTGHLDQLPTGPAVRTGTLTARGVDNCSREGAAACNGILAGSGNWSIRPVPGWPAPHRREPGRPGGRRAADATPYHGRSVKTCRDGPDGRGSCGAPARRQRDVTTHTPAGPFGRAYGLTSSVCFPAPIRKNRVRLHPGGNLPPLLMLTAWSSLAPCLSTVAVHAAAERVGMSVGGGVPALAA